MTNKTQLQEDDIILCTVKRVEGTTVFLDIETNGSPVQGTMNFSEVSPGRIRNIRDFVALNKKVVCKVLRLKNGHPELSLRRVTSREREEVLEKYKKEKILTNMLKSILQDKTTEIIKKIKEKYELSDFLDEARENQNILKKFFTPKQTSELEKIFSERKEKEKSVKREIKISSSSESGLYDIKNTLNFDKISISYLGSSKFSISVTDKDYKAANYRLEEILEQIKNNAKKYNVKLEVKEK